MHIPSVFCEENFDSIIDFIAAKPLATIIAQTTQGIEACPIPNNGRKSCYS
ncbi:FMN-binding negative transcriptional regulator [Psychrobacter glacincola]|uniref:FMN-binding negative transcriptional regulator n=1 Tax=Psychrobacter glacincola TaxID=56810 RepID=A0ABW1WBH6_9GAMM|nr:FMN-binding negative transcriptional regulator [Psychrobacter glacincola]